MDFWVLLQQTQSNLQVSRQHWTVTSQQRCTCVSFSRHRDPLLRQEPPQHLANAQPCSDDAQTPSHPSPFALTTTHTVYASTQDMLVDLETAKAEPDLRPACNPFAASHCTCCNASVYTLCAHTGHVGRS
jgi:hypothetical protein